MESEFPLESLLRQTNEVKFLTCITCIMRTTCYCYLVFLHLVNVTEVQSGKLLSSSVGNFWMIKTKYNI
jgi:hypothetical protein